MGINEAMFSNNAASLLIFSQADFAVMHLPSMLIIAQHLGKLRLESVQWFTSLPRKLHFSCTSLTFYLFSCFVLHRNIQPTAVQEGVAHPLTTRSKTQLGIFPRKRQVPKRHNVGAWLPAVFLSPGRYRDSMFCSRFVAAVSLPRPHQLIYWWAVTAGLML